ncbi:MAG: TIGR02147 family protein [Myxococcota bacterium]
MDTALWCRCEVLLATPPTEYTPDLIDRYTDYRKFVVHALELMGRSRRDLAEVLELSDSMLSQVLSRKRRLRATLVPALADFFGLGEDGRQILAALVDLDNESARARRTAWATIQAHQRYLAEARPADDILELMSSWYIAATWELAACEGFQADPRWIAKAMNPPITEEQAQHALQTLLRAGMLEPAADGSLKTVDQVVWTEQIVPQGPRAMAIMSLQRGVWDLAHSSYERFRANERHNSVSVFALSEDRYEAVVTRLRAVEQELMVLTASESDEQPNRVFALGVAMFPITDYTDSFEPDTTTDTHEP